MEKQVKTTADSMASARENCKVLLYSGPDCTGHSHDEFGRDSDITLATPITNMWKSLKVLGPTRVLAWEHDGNIEAYLPANISGAAGDVYHDINAEGKRRLRGDYVLFWQTAFLTTPVFPLLERVIGPGMTRLQVLSADQLVVAIELLDETPLDETRIEEDTEKGQEVGKKRKRSTYDDPKRPGDMTHISKPVGRFHLELNRNMGGKGIDLVALCSNESVDMDAAVNFWHGGRMKLVGKISRRVPRLQIPFTIMDMDHPGVNYLIKPRGVPVHSKISVLDFTLDMQTGRVSLDDKRPDWPRGVVCRKIYEGKYKIAVTSDLYEHYQRNATGWEPTMKDCVRMMQFGQEEPGGDWMRESNYNAQAVVAQDPPALTLTAQDLPAPAAEGVAPARKTRSLVEYMCDLEPGSLTITAETDRNFIIDALLRSDVATSTIWEPWGGAEGEITEEVAIDQATILADSFIAEALKEAAKKS